MIEPEERIKTERARKVKQKRKKREGAEEIEQERRARWRKQE